ncbi:MAG TPA: adenosylcobinamide-GDP ribazoletransferase [Ktedonosporobacter sp.]|nr:adenosylcobinamide-GDP ribazoletransferase [Ktedonosporobacter sp.]
MSQNMRELLSNMPSWSREQYKELAAAGRFLSILPLPDSTRLFGAEQVVPQLIMGSSYFPFIGLLLGLILWIVGLIFRLFVPAIALAAILVVALVILTGGLHLDGMMDSFDGLLGGTSPEHKLEIMRDSRVGSFGVLAGVCVLLLKFALLASLAVTLFQTSSLQATALMTVVFLIVLPAVRWGVVLAVRLFPSARTTGLGASFRQTVTLQRLGIAGGTSFLIALIVGLAVGSWLAGLAALLVWVGATIAALLAGGWIARNLGGLTGDSYGAIIEISEVAALLLVVLLRSWL